MKKIFMPTILAVSILLLVGCSNYDKAQKEFENGNYSEVLTLLEGKADKKSIELYDSANIKIFEKAINEALKNENVKLLSETVINLNKLYADSEKIADVENKLITEVENLLNESCEYKSFIFIENLCSELEKAKCKGSTLSQIKTILSKHDIDKLRAALTGTWIRRDDTPLSGCKIDIAFSENSGKAVLTYAVPNPYGFEDGDVKWKDIELYNTKNFYFEDLGKSTDYRVIGYSQSNANIDYTNMTISIHIVADSNSTGVDQVWVKEGFEAQSATQELTWRDTEGRYQCDDDMGIITISIEKGKPYLSVEGSYRGGYDMEKTELMPADSKNLLSIGEVELTISPIDKDTIKILGDSGFEGTYTKLK